MIRRHSNRSRLIALFMALMAVIICVAGQLLQARPSRCQEECDAMLEACHWTCENNVDVLNACDGNEVCLSDCWSSCEEPFLDCSFNASSCAVTPNGGCSAFYYRGYDFGDGWVSVFDPNTSGADFHLTCTRWYPRGTPGQ